MPATFEQCIEIGGQYGGDGSSCSGADCEEQTGFTCKFRKKILLDTAEMQKPPTLRIQDDFRSQPCGDLNHYGQKLIAEPDCSCNLDNHEEQSNGMSVDVYAPNFDSATCQFSGSLVVIHEDDDSVIVSGTTNFLPNTAGNETLITFNASVFGEDEFCLLYTSPSPRD